MTNAELDAKLSVAIEDFEKRIVALGERVVALEGLEPLMPRDLANLPSHENLTEITTAIDERISALEERVTAATPTAPTEDYVAAIDKLHVQLFGVPVGTVQSLRD